MDVYWIFTGVVRERFFCNRRQNIKLRRGEKKGGRAAIRDLESDSCLFSKWFKKKWRKNYFFTRIHRHQALPCISDFGEKNVSKLTWGRFQLIETGWGKKVEKDSRGSFRRKYLLVFHPGILFLKKRNGSVSLEGAFDERNSVFFPRNDHVFKKEKVWFRIDCSKGHRQWK